MSLKDKLCELLFEAPRWTPTMNNEIEGMKRVKSVISGTLGSGHFFQFAKTIFDIF
jgi:hypothetical protein